MEAEAGVFDGGEAKAGVECGGAFVGGGDLELDGDWGSGPKRIRSGESDEE